MSEAHGEGRLTIKAREIKDYVRISFTDDVPGFQPNTWTRSSTPFSPPEGKKAARAWG